MKVSLAALMINKCCLSTVIECTRLPCAGDGLQRLVQIMIYGFSFFHIYWNIKSGPIDLISFAAI